MFLLWDSLGPWAQGEERTLSEAVGQGGEDTWRSGEGEVVGNRPQPHGIRPHGVGLTGL